MNRLKSVPHLFGKTMVVCCVAAGTACSLWSMRILSRTGQDAANLLTPILAFFGGELALMFGKNALQSKTKNNGKEEKQDEYYQCS